MNTMEMTAAIQCILTAAQSLGFQDYFKKSRMTILGLAGVLFCENEQAQTKWIIVKSVQSALSDLKRPPESLQSQCNYRPFIT